MTKRFDAASANCGSCRRHQRSRKVQRYRRNEPARRAEWNREPGAGYSLDYWLRSILALAFGYIAKKEIRDSNEPIEGNGLATAGIVLGWVGIGTLTVVIGLIILGLMFDEEGKKSSQNSTSPATMPNPLPEPVPEPRQAPYFPPEFHPRS